MAAGANKSATANQHLRSLQQLNKIGCPLENTGQPQGSGYFLKAAVTANADGLDQVGFADGGLTR